MSETDTQLGGGYVYQWECAILLALNYFYDPVAYNPVLFDLIQGFLGRVGQIHLEGEDRERGVELEDINLIGADGQRRVLIQVKTKQAEGRQWTPSDPLLLKSLYRFTTSSWFADDVDRDNTCFVFLTNRSFNRSLVEIQKAIRNGTLADCPEVEGLYGSLTNYAGKQQRGAMADRLERESLDELLARTRFVEYLGLDQLKADVAFIGCNGVDPARGFTNTNIAEAEIKQAMVRSAEKTVFLADHDKIGQVASAFVADISGADLLITDEGADATVLGNLRADGLAIEVVRSRVK